MYEKLDKLREEVRRAEKRKKYADSTPMKSLTRCRRSSGRRRVCRFSRMLVRCI